MSRSLTSVSLVVVLGLASFGLPALAGDARQEVEETERRWAEAVERNDVDAIGRFLHDDFTFVNPRGVLLHRTEHLDDFRQKRTVFSKVELSEVEVRIYDDAAVVTSRPKITGYAVTPAGKTTFDARPGRFTDTLIRSGMKWLAVARHMSLDPAPPSGPSTQNDPARPRYTSQGELELPSGFRSWIFVGADLSPVYKPDLPESTRRERQRHEGEPPGDFHNIYVDRESYDAYLKTREFPDPTILVMEVFRAERKDAKGILKSGQFEGQRIGLEAAVKDRNRPGGGVPWAYYAFELDAAGKPAKSAPAFPDQSCYACHLKHASKDNVWVQFYPALRDLE